MADETEIRIKDLPRTATEADMVSGKFLVMDGSYTPKLPVELVAKTSSVVAVDSKLIPCERFEKAAYLHYESTKFTDGTGVVADSDRIGSGLIPVSEGDIIRFNPEKKPYSTTFVAADGKTTLTAGSGSISTKKITPANAAYVFVQYSRVINGVSNGAGLETELKLVKADEEKRLQYDDLGGKPDIDAKVAVTDAKLLPSAVFQLAKNLHTENTKFVSGTGVVADSDRIGSGLIPVSEGDIIRFNPEKKPYYVSFVASDGKTSLSSSSSAKVVVPTDTSYIFIQYKSGSYGSGLETELKLVKADEEKRLQYDDLGGKPDVSSVDALKNEMIMISEISRNSNRSYASEKSMSMAASSVVSETQSTDSFSISDTSSRKKVIALLHRRSKGDYTKVNDFFLPTASKNFGDVSFEDENGNKLPFDVISCGNYDVVRDSRLKIKGRVRSNSHGQVFGADYDGAIYASTDNGVAWVELLSDIDNKFDVAMCCNDDSILFATSAGKLYRSEYPYTSASVVLDILAEVGDFTEFTSVQCDKTSDGIIFVGSYQVTWNSKVFKSSDNGQTWTTVLHDTTYQHVHRVTVDGSEGYPVVYVGMDGGCGLYVSHDLGDTWTDLRSTIPNLPFVTDHGLIYSEPGLRLFGGETSYQNKANSLIKSTDDVHFDIVLAFGKPVYSIVKKNGLYFATTVSEGDYQTMGLLVSKDLEKWQTAFITSYENSSLSSGGYRILSEVGDELWIYCRNGANPVGVNSRIFVGGDNYCALVVIDVPSGVSSVTAKTGMPLPYINPARLENDVPDVLDIPLNGGGRYSLATFLGVEHVIDVGGEGVANGGRHLSDIYPPVGNFEDKFSAIVSKANGEVFEGSLPAGYTISFWMCMGNRIGSKLSLIKGERYEFKISDYRIYLIDGLAGTSVYENLFAQCGQEKVMQRIDISVESDGTFSMYINGNKKSRTYEWTMPDFGNTLRFLNYESGKALVLQHFEIRSGAITDEQAIRGYHGGTYDGMNGVS